jgi:intracellular multiplication protein IcmG
VSPTQKVPVAVSLPAVIPVQSAVPTTYSTTQPTTTTVVQSPANTQASLTGLTAESEKLMGLLQTQYTQQINEFSNQNKALQDQIQALTSRVSVMESQLNQLVQVLTRQHQNNSMITPVVPQVQPQASEVKIAYNVQAIIPGRAWLKSDNGETVTVTEGDMIKGVGRVTKIDPYDGLVEINSGGKAVSLSYGNGG